MWGTKMDFYIFIFAIFGLLLAVRGDSGTPAIGATNPFKANLEKRIDPNDELLQIALWGGE
jgi:hypothetical protein